MFHVKRKEATVNLGHQTSVFESYLCLTCCLNPSSLFVQPCQVYLEYISDIDTFFFSVPAKMSANNMTSYLLLTWSPNQFSYHPASSSPDHSSHKHKITLLKYLTDHINYLTQSL